MDDLAAHLEFRTEFAGEGYAMPTPECVEAVALARDLEGFRLDTTYSGKALACLVADARSGRLAGATPVVATTTEGRTVLARRRRGAGRRAPPPARGPSRPPAR